MASIQGQFVVSTDGTKIWAERIGDQSKPPVVFLHGVAFSAAVFDKQFTDQRLREKLHMVRYDIRGHGRSDQPATAEAYTSKCMADDFAAVCEAFRLTRPFLAGWSYGGTIGADVCEHLGADYLSGEILLSGVPYGAAFMEVGTHQVASTFRILADPDCRATEHVKALNELVDSCVADALSIPIETRWLWQGMVISQKPQTLQLLRRRQQDVTNLLAAGIKLPVLIIQGAKDKHLDVSKMEQLTNEKFGAGVSEFHALAGSGHMPFYECPEQTNQLMLEFIYRMGSA